MFRRSSSRTTARRLPVGPRLLVGAALLIPATMVGSPNAAAQEVAVWTGAVSGDWFLPENWQAGQVPAPFTPVLVERVEPHAPVISGADAFAASVQVTGLLTVDPGGALSVTESGVRVERTGVLTLDQASIDGAVSNDGQVVVRGGPSDVSSYDASSGGLLIIDLPSGASSLAVAGEARIGGGRLIATVASSDPPAGTTHRIVTAGTRAGTFAFTETGPYSLRYDDTGVELYVPAATTTSLTSAPHPAAYGQAVELTAVVGPPATGTVRFTDGTTALGEATLDSTGTARFVTSALAVGTHMLTATYGGDAGHAPSTSTPVSQTIDRATTTTSIVADDPDPSAPDEPYTVQVTVTPLAPGRGIPTGPVVVSDDEAASCTIVSLVDGGGTCPLTSTAGVRTLTARYAGDPNFAASVSAAEPHAVQPPVLSIGDVAVAEGRSGRTTATFPVSLDRASTREVSVRFATANGTATAPSDYAALGGSLTFAAGETAKQVTVQVEGDTVDELDESFSVSLSGATGATLGDGTGVGTIRDDDRDGGLTCTASAVALLGSRPVVANPARTPCQVDAKSAVALNVNLGLLRVQAAAPRATTDQTPPMLAGTRPAPGDAAASTAQLATTRISTIGLTIEVGATTSTASARCQARPDGNLAPAYSGSSSIGALKVNGLAVPIGSGPVTIPLLVGTLKLNGTTTTATGVTQRALELRSLLGDVVLGEAHAGVTGTPTHPTGNPCQG
ncbi:Ig-like domain repeat protein [Tenggerimyces flavus]|uniref:Ig-like domain repeat protein n=1 Tax=Tenggerimyces flavus TaxID=1708749 RepID=A0ABV7YPC3_9ACTN|nr:Ig-like domain repeat protein [Tenggerimyces flavus]MBM7784804.1 hypothetical protein [Tenggerimyces flavus]